MSTIGSLLALAADPGIKPWNDIMHSATQTKTGLINLADLKAKQAAEQEYLQAIKDDPELRQRLFGDSVLGSIGPAGGRPAPGGGPPPGAITQSPLGGGSAQQIPAAPDLSQFATQGAPQSTIASLGPAGQPQMPGAQNPALAMAATNPRAALLMQGQMQAQQDAQMKRYGDHLAMGTKIAEAVGREAQAATDQASWDRARANVAQFNPKAAAEMQAVYSPEAKAEFIKRAGSVKDNAQLQLETWGRQIEERKNQIEEQKLGVQLANAGYQGLGTDVTSILRGLTDEQVQQFGGRTSAKAIAYATGKVKDLDIEKREKEGLAGAQATAQAQQQARLDKTVSEAFGERTTKIYDAQTGQTVDARMKVKDYEALPAGRVKELSANSTEIMENVNNAIPLVAQLQTYMDKIYGPGGILARMTPEDRSLWSSWTDSTAATSLGAQFMQKYPELTQAQRFIDSNAGALARAIAGEKGAMAEGDVERAKAMMPNLKTAFTVWPPSALGATLPDTRAVALRTMNSMVDTINARMKTLLGNEQFAHPRLRRYETAEDAQTAAGGTVTAPPVEPPPPQGRQPGEIPVLGGPGMPEQYLPAPGKQSQAQPGRRGIELARASGYKVMDMRDVDQAMEETGKSRAEVLAAARAKGYTVYGAAASSALA